MTARSSTRRSSALSVHASDIFTASTKSFPSSQPDGGQLVVGKRLAPPRRCRGQPGISVTDCQVIDPRTPLSNSARDDGRAAPGTLVAGRIVGLGTEPERSVELVRVPCRRVRVTCAPLLERSVQITDRTLAQEDGDSDRRTTGV